MVAMGLKDRSVVVMGLGHFGGGIGVTRWLVQEGALVTVTDKATPDKLADSLNQVRHLPIKIHIGGHDPADLDGCDLLVVSPAIDKALSEFVQEAQRRDIRITSEMNLFLERCPARRIIGITGSAGKSTTTAMIGEILQGWAKSHHCSRVWVGGNIGRSLLDDLEVIASDDIVVLELSSFQLEDMAELRWSPPFSVITNIEPNHLDRHGTLEAYADAKLNIIRYQRPDGLIFIQAGNGALAERVRQAGGAERLRRFTFDPSFAECLQIPGRHNQENAAAAIAVARSVGVSDEWIRQGLKSFKGLPHRLEFVAERGGVRYYNDSKSTTPASTCLAVQAFDRPVIVLVGGRDKQMPFNVMNKHLARGAKGVVCYGETGEKLRKEISEQVDIACRSGVGTTAKVSLAGNKLEEAIRQVQLMAEPGDVVVLSPACTSYDMFTSYEQRGEEFRRLVQELPQG